eukprot:CAMPEP_0182594568 /NCGR_PEP_ID=MMETSP1324-20130603/80434_1 /TAXON_ID=236786 /ORGANISM="Florenciella sp., Strain RCC1587" /LENGTH=111 /DNA_ID=CAMNT_0024812123 /DNA_START=245 /DNA_END=576 /DNA_ORIENTATION=-
MEDPSLELGSDELLMAALLRDETDPLVQDACNLLDAGASDVAMDELADDLMAAVRHEAAEAESRSRRASPIAEPAFDGPVDESARREASRGLPEPIASGVAPATSAATVAT